MAGQPVQDVDRARQLEAWIANYQLGPAPAEPPKRRGRKPDSWWRRIRKPRARDT